MSVDRLHGSFLVLIPFPAFPKVPEGGHQRLRGGEYVEGRRHVGPVLEITYPQLGPSKLPLPENSSSGIGPDRW